MNVLIIDNYDSFTFNLYQLVGEILSAWQRTDSSFTYQLWVKRNDELTLAEIEALEPDRVIVSPGPGNPQDASYFGVCAEVIRHLGTRIPLLGVCLGMQGIVHVFGGDVVKAPLPMHGKLSPIVHDGKGVFYNVPQAVEVMRYHSLVADNGSLPECLQVTAYILTDGQNSFEPGVPRSEIMGIRHVDYPIQGVQFHPESFASEGGRDLLENFLFLRS